MVNKLVSNRHLSTEVTCECMWCHMTLEHTSIYESPIAIHRLVAMPCHTWKSFYTLMLPSCHFASLAVMVVESVGFGNCPGGNSTATGDMDE